MFSLRSVCAVAMLTASTAAPAARLSFERIVPAPHSLGDAEDLLLSYAIGDNDKISTFVEVFVDQAGRGGSLRVLDAGAVERPAQQSRRDKKPPRVVERKERVDAYLRVSAFTCQTVERSGEGGSYDVDGNRVRRTHRWFDAACTAHVQALAANDRRKLAEFSSHGEGTSPRVTELTEEDRAIALDQAARYAAIAAAEQIRPRRIRETIELIEEGPQFEAGMAWIDSDNLAEARRVWEEALAQEKRSAALHFNLAAVCEALTDWRAAELHYSEAERLAPAEARFRYEHEMFRYRNGLQSKKKRR